MGDSLFDAPAGGEAVCRPASRARRPRPPELEDLVPDERCRLGVNRVAGEWCYMVLLPGGRCETGEAESWRDAWLDARQLLRNARGY